MKRVYFLRPVGLDGPVKIGCSIEPDKRLATIVAWSPILLEVAAVIDGDTYLEAALHRRFAHLAMHGEWFGVDDDLLAVIASAQAGEPVTIKTVAALPNMRVASTLKGQLSRRVSDAEVHAYGFRCTYGEGRPAEVRAIMDAYQGPHTAPPSVEDQKVLTAYVTRLRAMPKSLRLHRDRWSAWEAYRDHGVLPASTDTEQARAAA